jgi:DNA-binding transcriptional regulator YiaG
MVKKLRTQIGMSQAQFADALGVSQSLVTHWETGRRQPSPGLALQIVNLARKHNQKLTMEALYTPQQAA